MNVWNSRENIFKRGFPGWRKREGYYVREERNILVRGSGFICLKWTCRWERGTKGCLNKGERRHLWPDISLVLFSRKITSPIPWFCGMRWSGSLLVWGGSKCVAGWNHLQTSQGPSGHSSCVPTALQLRDDATVEQVNAIIDINVMAVLSEEGPTTTFPSSLSLQHTSNKCAVFPHGCLS